MWWVATRKGTRRNQRMKQWTTTPHTSRVLKWKIKDVTFPAKRNHTEYLVPWNPYDPSRTCMHTWARSLYVELYVIDLAEAMVQVFGTLYVSMRALCKIPRDSSYRSHGITYSVGVFLREMSHHYILQLRTPLAWGPIHCFIHWFLGPFLVATNHISL